MIAAHFHKIVEKHAGTVAIVDGGERILYRTLAERAAAIRRRLRAKLLQLTPGDVVAVSLPNSSQFAAAFLAVAAEKAVFMPCNPQWRASELAGFAEKINFRGVITSHGARRNWDQIAEKLPRDCILTTEELETEPYFASDEETGPECPDDFVLYLATSGSTGRPRVVPRTQKNLLAGAENVRRALQLQPGERFLSVVPFYHANGFSNCMFLPLMTGCTIAIMREFSPSACWELSRHERPQIMIGSPLVYSLLCEHWAGGPSGLEELRLCLSSGARISPELSRRWRSRFGLPIRQLYGSSETGVISIDRGSGDAPEHAENGLGAYAGTPIPGVEVRILDEGGCEVQPGVVGEIAVRSPAMMPGYVGESELNAGLFTGEGLLRTGDLGFITPGDGIVLTGRLRRMLNLGGIKVDPMEIEQVLEAMPGVRACHVSAFSGPREADVVQAVIAVNPAVAVSRAMVVEHCRNHLAEYKIPRVIRFVEHLPADLAGKIRASTE